MAAVVIPADRPGFESPQLMIAEKNRPRADDIMA